MSNCDVIANFSLNFRDSEFLMKIKFPSQLTRKFYLYLIAIKYIRDSNVVNGGHVLLRKLKETIILNKYDLKWKETSEKCKWEHCTR